MPREVALVQCEKLPLGQFAESLTVLLGNEADPRRLDREAAHGD